MKKVIWLCSWYPNELDAFRGDFVQRQAQASSLFAHITVLHIVFTNYNKVVTNKISATLTEKIVYLKRYNKLINYIHFIRTHDKFLKEYEIANGKPDLLHVQIPIKAGLLALRYKKKFKIPYVVTEHYGIYNHLVQEPFASRSFWFRQLTKKILKNASAFLPVSSSLGKDINREVMPLKYQPISNAVDCELFNYQSKTKKSIFRFIHTSSLSEVKNPSGILEAIETLYKIRQDFQVEFIGSTNNNFKKEALEKKLLNQVIFIQAEVSYEQVALENAQANAGLLFSHSESQSCVVLEWLCCGLPVISSRVGGVVELINKTNGILVQAGHVNELVTAMSNMIDSYDQYNCSQISAEAIAKYSYPTIGKKINEVYESVLSI